jgi:hypothetical protein
MNSTRDESVRASRHAPHKLRLRLQRLSAHEVTTLPSESPTYDRMRVFTLAGYPSRVRTSQ